MPDAHLVRTEDPRELRKRGIRTAFHFFADSLRVELTPMSPTRLGREATGGIGFEIPIHRLSRNLEPLGRFAFPSACLDIVYNPFT
jgi:hypothetical protein